MNAHFLSRRHPVDLAHELSAKLFEVDDLIRDFRRASSEGCELLDNLPVRLPMVEIRTIGAGGGSIAAVDDAGRLRVGPRSAKSWPGPVCYGRGGVEPTVTDANIALGKLDPRFFLGGAMALDLDGARAALLGRVGAPLGLGMEQAAAGILAVTDTSLAAAARLSLFEKGLDPRGYGDCLQSSARSAVLKPKGPIDL